MQELVDLVRTLAAALVDQPEAVRVSDRQGDGEHVLVVSVAPGDLGKVIGRGGSTVQALRVLLGAVAQQRAVRCRLEIAE